MQGELISTVTVLGKMSNYCSHCFNCNIFLTGTNAVGAITYWVGSAFFTFVDLTGKPAWVLRYKIQDNKQVPVSVKYCMFLAYSIYIL